MQIKEPVNILDVPVHPLTMQEAVSVLENSIANGEQAFVVTANAEIIMMCQQDAEYKKIVSQDAQLVLPDGAGAVWAGRHLGYKVPERVAGFDLYCNLLKEAAAKGYKAQGVSECARVLLWNSGDTGNRAQGGDRLQSPSSFRCGGQA